MRTLLAALLAGAPVVLSGCVSAPPARRSDALAEVFGAGAAASAAKTRTLTLALIPTQTTKDTSEYLKKVASGMGGGYIVRDPSSYFRDARAVLASAFAEVLPVESLEEARAKGAHLVGALDLYAKLGNVSFQLVVAEMTVAFVSLAGEPVATIRGRSTYRMPYPNIGGPHWDEVSGAATADFGVALSTNVELAAYAARVAPAAKPVPAAAPAVVSAPAAPSFRSDVEAPSFRLPEDASKFAVVVGVEKYQVLPAAEHAARDARAVKAHLLAAGYPERNIVFLTDAQAGKSGFEKYLDAWLPKNVDERSTLFFYFSGHGAPDAEKGEAYLMPWDGDAKFVESTGYPVKRLYEKLAALKARRVLLAMDACFSGAGGRSVLAKGLRPLVAKVDLGASSAGRVVSLSAAAADEVTGTDESSGHGLFTYHLLKGLSAKGGKATFRELYDYLSPKVRDAARRDNRDQTPQLIGAGSASL